MDVRVRSVITQMGALKTGGLSIGSLARSVNLTPARLRQLFKAETGESPIQYLTDLRMQRASKLLRTGFLSVKEITFMVGLRDVSHFVRNFKMRYGLTPSEFRAKFFFPGDRACG
jgi:transcriptional regulator GlxA family with amidase domain